MNDRLLSSLPRNLLGRRTPVSPLLCYGPRCPHARRPIAEITCFKCGNKGHCQANCPDNATPPTSTPATGTALSAYLVEALEEVEELDDSERILVPSGVTGAW